MVAIPYDMNQKDTDDFFFIMRAYTGKQVNMAVARLYPRMSLAGMSKPDIARKAGHRNRDKQGNPYNRRFSKLLHALQDVPVGLPRLHRDKFYGEVIHPPSDDRLTRRKEESFGLHTTPYCVPSLQWSPSAGQVHDDRSSIRSPLGPLLSRHIYTLLHAPSDHINKAI